MRLAPLLALLLSGACAAPRPPSMPPYPAARRDDVVDRIHGTEVRDPYRWLEDGSSPDVKTWASAQDALARGVLAGLPEREAIAARLRELASVDETSIPVKRGGRLFVARRKASQEKWVVFARDGADGPERTLLDPNAWSPDGSVSLGSWVPSWDGRKVAYQRKANNSDEATLFVIDADTGAVTDPIDGAKYAYPSWTPAGDGFYYVRVPTDPSIPAAKRPGMAELRFHALGTDPATDRLVHPASGDPSTFVSGALSRDGRFLVVTIWHGWSSSDVKIMDLSAPSPAFVPVTEGRSAMTFVEAWQGRLYVTTNDGAPRWRVLRADPARPSPESWEEIVPERADATLSSTAIVGGKLALAYLENVTSRLEIRELDGTRVREVPLPGIGSASLPSGAPDDDEAWFSFESFTSPREIFAMSAGSGAQRSWHRAVVPVDSSKYETEQAWCVSRDGTRVPYFVIHAKGARRDGSAPCILYGYGGFLDAQAPAFLKGIFPWLERGGIHVVASLRGGGEFGEDWHRAGMLLNKQNVFDDAIAVAEQLVADGWTKPGRLTISGQSNGGLLVGAVITQRPDLFSAALCGVPLLDMVRYHLHGSGSTWVPEYGSAEEPGQFRALLAYSPYHRVTPGTRYPAVLLSSADSDDRVDPLHARKFAALLQASTTGGPVLLRVEKNAGHGGADMVRAWVELTADQLAFALAQSR